MAKRPRPAASKKPARKAAKSSGRASSPAKPSRGKAAASAKTPARSRNAARTKPAQRVAKTRPAAAKARPDQAAGKSRHNQAAKAKPDHVAAKTKSAPLPPALPVSEMSQKAVEIFERGFRALQQRDYAKASDILSSLVTSYPEEKELHERARVFLAVCERRASSHPQPRTAEERIYAATVAINRGDAGKAVELLDAVAREQPEHDHVHYLLAIALGSAGDTSGAIGHLRRAIELRPSNRLQASQDADLDSLRGEPAFRALVDAAR